MLFSKRNGYDDETISRTYKPMDTRVPTTTISDSVIGHDHVAPATMASATNFGIPLTGSMATGFAFMKGW